MVMIVGAGLSGVLLSSCTGGGCTEIGCLGGVNLSVLEANQVVALSALDGATMTVCQNEHCATDMMGLHGTTLELAGTFQATASISVGADNSSASQLEVRVLPVADLDGDTYRVTIDPADGSPAIERTWTVVGHTDAEINGPGCGTCRSTDLSP